MSSDHPSCSSTGRRYSTPSGLTSLMCMCRADRWLLYRTPDAESRTRVLTRRQKSRQSYRGFDNWDSTRASAFSGHVVSADTTFYTERVVHHTPRGPGTNQIFDLSGYDQFSDLPGLLCGMSLNTFVLCLMRYVIRAFSTISHCHQR